MIRAGPDIRHAHQGVRPELQPLDRLDARVGRCVPRRRARRHPQETASRRRLDVLPGDLETNRAGRHRLLVERSRRLRPGLFERSNDRLERGLAALQRMTRGEVAVLLQNPEPEPHQRHRRRHRDEEQQDQQSPRATARQPGFSHSTPALFKHLPVVEPTGFCQEPVRPSRQSGARLRSASAPRVHGVHDTSGQ